MPKKAFETFRVVSVLYAGTFAFMAGLLPFILLAKGMDAAAIALYFAIYSFTALVLEVPTGAFADAYGRKRAILLGFLLMCIFLPGFILLPGGWLFTLFAFVVAAADAFMSGSAEAYAVDMLYGRGKMDYTHKLLASSRTWKFGVFLLGSLIGGFAAQYSILLPAALCLPFAFGGLAYSWLWLEDDKKKADFEKAEKSLLRKMGLSLAVALQSPSIGAIYIITLLIGLGSFGLFLYWQIALHDAAGWGPDMMGFFFALISLAIIIGARLSSGLEAGWKSVALLMALLALLLGLAAWTPVPLAIAAFVLLWELAFGIYQPMEGSIINHNTEPSIRATVISVNALSYRIGWVVLGGLVALYSIGDPRELWYAGAVFFLMAAAMALYAMFRRLPAASGTSRGWQSPLRPPPA